ncbi:MAG: sigma-E factor negative regulatory protein [Caldimonas sp.]
MASEAIDGVNAERLSALVDGALDGAATAAACKDWKSDAQARCTWHAYHLIGDVLRSDGLADGAVRDEQFLVSLRARLAAEPIVFAPAPLATPPAPLRASTLATLRTHRWLLPSAMAAGLVLVVGTFTVLRPPGSTPTGAPAVTLADAMPVAAVDPSLRTASINEPVGSMPVVMNGKLIRDARLDRYLAAHKQFSGSSALGLPSAFLRSATVESDSR